MKKIIRTRKYHSKTHRAPLMLRKPRWRRGAWSLSGKLLKGRVRVSLTGSLRDVSALAAKLGITPKRLAQARARGDKETARAKALSEKFKLDREAARLSRRYRNKK